MSSNTTKETTIEDHHRHDLYHVMEAYQLPQQEEEEKEKEDEEDVRTLLTNGLQKLSHQERCQIQDEMHGVKSMGLSTEQENTRTALKEFKEHLDRTLLLAQQCKEEEQAKTSDVMDSPPDTSLVSFTVAYEICLKRNYMYATEYDASLRLMCLRADLWNPQKACDRFLSYLNMLYKHYGEDGLKQSLTLAHLDQDTTSSSSPSLSSSSSLSWQVNAKDVIKKIIKKKTTRTVEQRGSKKSHIGTRGMVWLRSGGIQLLPSRDRSGRRVVIFELGSTNQDDCQCQPQQTQLQGLHEMFKAMLYFFSTIARCDAEAQRDGLVLILSYNKASSKNYCENQQTQQKQYLAFFQVMPIRFCVVHACYDTDSDTALSKMQTCTLKSFGNGFTTRVRFHSKDAGNSETQVDLATYGIPVHELPVTPTGTIKLKQHIQWIKIHAWFELQDKQRQRKEELLAAQAQHQEQMMLQQQRKQEIDNGMVFNDFIFLNPNHRLQQHHHQQQLSLPQSLWSSSFLPLPPLDQGQHQRSEEKRATQNINCNSSFNNININSNQFEFESEIIECPRVNDVLFHQGGKYWNGTNKFQRGNNEFMELLATKIPAYRNSGSPKKKQDVITSFITEFKESVKGARFLEKATQINGVDAPEGCWIELPLDSPLLKQKFNKRITNQIRRLGCRMPNLKKRRRQPPTSPSTKPSNNNNNNINNNNNNNKNIKSLLSCDGLKPPKKAKKMNDVAIIELSSSLSSSMMMTLTSCNSNNNNDDGQRVLKNVRSLFANDEHLVQAILDKDNTLIKEIDEQFGFVSGFEFSFDEDEEKSSAVDVDFNVDNAFTNCHDTIIDYADNNVLLGCMI